MQIMVCPKVAWPPATLDRALCKLVQGLKRGGLYKGDCLDTVTFLHMLRVRKSLIDPSGVRAGSVAAFPSAVARPCGGTSIPMKLLILGDRRRFGRRSRLFLLSVLAFATTGLAAQTVPDAGALMKQYEQLQRPLPSVLPPAEATKEARELKSTGPGMTVRVKSVRFSGATDLVPENELQALVADAVGKELDFPALQQLADRVTDLLKSRGWFLARAYLPRQDVTEGNIEIVILAGRLSDSNPAEFLPGSDGMPRIDPGFLSAMLDDAVPRGNAIHESQVDRAVLLMGDLPGIDARARLKPGDKTDETRLELTINEGPLLSASPSLDNFGNKTTGTNQLNLSATLNDPSGYGDQGALMLTKTEGLDLARLSYGVVGIEGLKVGLSHTTMEYDFETLTSSGNTALMEGESTTTGLSFSYPWVRSRISNLYANLTLAKKSMVDRADHNPISDKSIESATVQIVGDHLDALGGGGMNNWSLGMTSGNLDLSGLSDNYAYDQNFGYRTHGPYKKYNLSLSRLQKLPGAFTVNLALSAQWAGKNLDSSEKFYLGGPNGVRAYPGSEAGGDQAALANLEFKYDWPGGTELGNLQLQAFFDAGWVHLHKDTRDLPIATATGRNHFPLFGAGLGMTLTQRSEYSVRALWAHRVGSNPGRTTAGMDSDGEDNDHRFWLQAMAWF